MTLSGIPLVATADSGVATAPDRAAEPERVDQPILSVRWRGRNCHSRLRIELLAPGCEAFTAVTRDVHAVAGRGEEGPVTGIARRGRKVGDGREAAPWPAG